ncbi:MAG: hypothetical protein Q7K42_05860, partial [Candidatus Diapherotrites archaeon]|nr:hypothetical protein [Candidatus Diapherotrites archaeon]
MNLKIGNFEVGEYYLKEQGGKKNLIFDCRNCPYSSSISDDKACRYHVLYALQQYEADVVVLYELYERVYNEEQSAMLSEISSLAAKFRTSTLNGKDKLGDPSIDD